MRLSVRHSTLYQFDAPMRFVTQSHRLTPASTLAAVLEWTVGAEGAEFGAGFTDGAGDAVNTMTVQGPVERIAVLVEGTVETTDTPGMLRDTARRSRRGSICSRPGDRAEAGADRAARTRR